MLADRLQSDELPQINMTPMVDVVLCLLVFFMAATRLYDWDENEFTVKVPEVSDAAPLTSAPDDLALTVLAPNKVALKDRTLDLMGLTKALEEARGRYADQGVLIRGDGQLAYQDLADVLSACNAALFAVIFAETGLVIAPFLPGDSLLFAVGAVSATPNTPISLPLVAVLLSVAAVLGDAVNYFIGYRIGPKVFASEGSWLLNKKHLLEAQAFYDKYGGKTIILARFVPIVRTFAPFVAGVGRMDYRKFLLYNVVGGVSWVLICLIAGWWFGSWPFVQKNFELVLVAVVAISVLPIVFELVRAWIAARKGASVLGIVPLAILLAAGSSSALDDRDPKTAAFAKRIGGDWEGTLEYRDDSNDKRVKLPTTLRVVSTDDQRGAVLKFRYDEGKGRFVEGESTLRVDSGKNALTWESDGGKVKTEYALTGLDAFVTQGKTDLILTGLGLENGQEVEIRQTITRDGDELKIARDTRKSGDEFVFRNAYAFKRKLSPAPAPKAEPR
jgi:membrane-associated protein